MASRTARIAAAIAALFRGRPRLPHPGQTVVWWNTFTGDSHYYQAAATLDRDPTANDGMPWTVELTRDRQFYERKVCPTANAALDLQAAWKRMVRQRGLGRVYWVGSASIGRFDILIVERDGEWRLLLYVKDRHAQSRTFATEQEAIDAGTSLDTELRSRPWFTWELSGKDPGTR